MNENDVRAMYRFLAHEKETEIRIPGNPGKKQYFVHSEDEFVSVCKRFDGKQNLYAGINERKPGGSESKDVISVRSIFLDIDAVRPDMKQPATDEELEKADRVASQIQYDFLQRGFASPIKIMTGNGYQLACAVPEIYVNHKHKNDIETKLQLFQDEIIAKYSGKDAKIDKIGDLPRIVKIWGTKSVKGTNTQERPHRESFVHTIDPKRIEDIELRDYILDLKPPEKPQISPIEFIEIPQEDLNQLFDIDPKLKDLYEGKWEQYGYKSRSEAEEALVVKLAYEKIPKEQAFSIMQNSKIGKWEEKDHRYWNRTWERAVQFVAENPQEERYLYSFSKLYYRTDHLKFYENLDGVIELSGSEYTIINKAQWYSLVGVAIRKIVKFGKIYTDTRFPLLIPVSSGGGKKNYIEAKKDILSEIGYTVATPTSLHPEQLVGTTRMVTHKEKDPNTNMTLKTKKPKHILGYLRQDVVIFKEGLELIRSRSPAITESRGYINIALDPIFQNEIVKKQVDFDYKERLCYFPHCSIDIYFQPYMVKEEFCTIGFGRRFLTLYQQFNKPDRFEAYRDRILGSNNREGNIKIFADYLKTIKQRIDPVEFSISSDALQRVIELHSELVLQGLNHSERGRNYTEILDFDLQNYLVKMAAILCASNGRTQITIQDVELAFMDLTEFFAHSLEFVNRKVIGRLDYGESWRGAIGDDKTALEWLFEESESKEVTIQEYQEKVSEVFGVGFEAARKIYYKHIDNGWVKSKRKGKHSSIIWLDFVPKVTSGKSGATGRRVLKNTYTQIAQKLEKNKGTIVPLLPPLPVVKSRRSK